MSDRRFVIGETGRMLGLEYRIERGSKSARRAGWDDLRLVWRIPTWTPVSMHWLYLGTDFLTENEDGRYPPEQHFRGGEFLMAELRRARDQGWRHVSESLDVDITRSINTAYRDGVA